MNYQIYVVKVFSNGDKYWYRNGDFHRDDGPAIECANGDKHWYQNDQRHRTDGPAIEYANGVKYWYLNGKKLTESEFYQQTKPSNCDGKYVEVDGVKYKLVKV